MSYGIALIVKHVTQADGLIVAAVEVGTVSGLPPEGGYAVNGHLYTGPGEAGDSINVSTPHGFVSSSALSAPSTAAIRSDLLDKYAVNRAVWDAQREVPQAPTEAEAEADVVEIVDEA